MMVETLKRFFKIINIVHLHICKQLFWLQLDRKTDYCLANSFLLKCLWRICDGRRKKTILDHCIWNYILIEITRSVTYWLIMGYLSYISTKYGKNVRWDMDIWIKSQRRLVLLKEQRTFLIKCRKKALIPAHILNHTNKFKFTIYTIN